MLLRDRLRAQYFRDWLDAILEDVRRELWCDTPRQRRKLHNL